ncbi:MAG TPA: exodeoxyribonuclease VII large subunit [Candidatus Saccharimonadales bacterium]|jgi:exodeoxyribonuclease VII large subunit
MAVGIGVDPIGGLPDLQVTVSEFVDIVNETFEFAFPSIVITGELANLRVSKNRWVYFDLKDEGASVKFFGTIYSLPGPLEDGMLLNVRGIPHLHELYGFSVNVQFIQPAGEGSIRRAAELLRAKLQAEGLFDAERKRPLPYPPKRIGLITSAQSAAYADFIKILGARWAGLRIDLIDVQVQGEVSPGQIVAAIESFNALASPPDVLALIRGGGSADDLAGFSSEQVTRAVAASRVPTIAAIGHETDVSLAELAADVRASTPSNAAELLTPDKRAVLETLAGYSEQLYDAVSDRLYDVRTGLADDAGSLHDIVTAILSAQRDRLSQSRQLLAVLSPHAALQRGYAIIRGADGRHAPHLAKGDIVHIELLHSLLTATVTTTRTKDT